MMTDRTAIFYIDGDRYIFRGEQVDEVLSLATAAESIPEAWEQTKDYGEEIDA